MGWFRRKIFTGLIIILPTVVTGYVIYWLFRSIDSILGPVVKRFPILDFPGFGFISVIVVILLVGVIAGNFVGRQVIEGIERLVRRIPLVNRMYIGIKQISEVFLTQERTVFRKAILIQYPRPGIYVIGFVTSRWIVRGADGAEHPLMNVFLPTTPNPTSGLFLMIPESEATPIDCSIDDALKMVISGGAFIPSIRGLDIPDHASAEPDPGSDPHANH